MAEKYIWVGSRVPRDPNETKVNIATVFQTVYGICGRTATSNKEVRSSSETLNGSMLFKPFLIGAFELFLQRLNSLFHCLLIFRGNRKPILRDNLLFTLFKTVAQF